MKIVELEYKEQTLIMQCLVDLKLDMENDENFKIEEIKEVENLIEKIMSPKITRKREYIINDFMRDCILIEFREKLESSYDLTKLMNEMEELFKIPTINDEMFNKANKDVIKFYREVADLRIL